MTVMEMLVGKNPFTKYYSTDDKFLKALQTGEHCFNFSIFLKGLRISGEAQDFVYHCLIWLVCVLLLIFQVSRHLQPMPN